MSTRAPSRTPLHQSSETPTAKATATARSLTVYDTLDFESRDTIDAADHSAALALLDEAAR